MTREDIDDNVSKDKKQKILYNKHEKDSIIRLRRIGQGVCDRC